eukprot:TRINITY_DN3854_c1_g2_i2.p1 TRINITY_DN3854_c1_g2~~TRINITY_DN3854_c1_g2_i2.p1  ORF type:complete len:339 (+),score=37.70 TRINITY_DN3854_c1_g2_i2:1068-2084(+)
MPTNKECLNFLSGSGNEDRNIFVLKDGIVSETYKGLPDEVNNELFTNYTLHKQTFPQPISSKVMRCVPLRVVVALRCILIKLRRIPICRESVVHALESKDFNIRSKCLKDIDLTKLGENLESDDWKLISFHIGQTLLLTRGIEVYSKASLSELIPPLKPLLYRASLKYTSSELNDINNLKQQLISNIEDVKSIKNGDLSLFTIEKERAKNHFHRQCRGIVVNIIQERLVYYPLSHFIEQLDTPKWPDDNDVMSKLEDDNFLGFFMDTEGKYYFTSEDGFQPKDIKKIMSSFRSNKTLFTNLLHDDERHYVILKISNGHPKVVLRRNKHKLEDVHHHLH